MEKIKNLSIRKAIVLYIVLSLIISFLAGALIMWAAKKTQEQIWWKYVDEEKFYKAREIENGYYTATVPRPGRYEMTEMDVTISELCDFLQTYGILVVSVIGAILAVVLFYRDKIKKPIEELAAASEMIAQNELEFRIAYSNKDELGSLCVQFEKMRQELEKNNRDMWRIIEEEKALRSAIAHDIRTPLAVLKGYQEMLLEFVPEESFDKESTIKMLKEGMGQIERIHDFIETMRKLSSLEEREIEYREEDLEEIGAGIERNMKILASASGKELTLEVKSTGRPVFLDASVVVEVTENLVSNALRYARRSVNIDMTVNHHALEVVVRDDGKGFTEGDEQVTKAYYHSNPQDDLNHFGLGLYISRIYCEKHGGRLLTGNSKYGGAEVKAVFNLKS